MVVGTAGLNTSIVVLEDDSTDISFFSLIDKFSMMV